MAASDKLAEIERHVRAALQRYRDGEAPRERPFLTLTYAQSIDGSIAAQAGVPTLLSGPLSMKMTHMLRSLHDGILVGVGTIIADNPSLNTRLVQGTNPTPIILDSTLRCPLSIKLFTSEACVKPIILFVNSADDPDLLERKRVLEAHGARVLACNGIQDAASGRLHIDLRDAARVLKLQGLESVMVEGGAAVLTACCQESAVSHFMDLAVVTIAPTIIGGLRAVGSLLPTFVRLAGPKYFGIGDDLVILGHFPPQTT